jgi:hypothetical protein
MAILASGKLGKLTRGLPSHASSPVGWYYLAASLRWQYLTIVSGLREQPMEGPDVDAQHPGLDGSNCLPLLMGGSSCFYGVTNKSFNKPMPSWSASAREQRRAAAMAVQVAA